MKTDILENLADPDLICLRVSRSVSALRHFELEGLTYSEHVLAQRLLLAYRMLSDSRFAGLAISAIALTVGLNDLSYFNRTFRRRFGATPSDVRGCRVKPE